MTAMTTTTTRVPLPAGAVTAGEWQLRGGDLIIRYVDWAERGEPDTARIQNTGEQAYRGEVIDMHPILTAGDGETIDLRGDIPALLELHANLWATIEELAAIRGYDLSDARAKVLS